jgi:hypothetical protein
MVEALMTIGTNFGVTTRTKCMRELGGFDVTLRLLEDTDFFFRLLDRGFLAAVVPGVHVICHDHAGARGTHREFHPIRIEECGLVLQRHAPFLGRHPTVREAFVRYVESLKRELADMGGGVEEAVPRRDHADDGGGDPPGSPQPDGNPPAAHHLALARWKRVTIRILMAIVRRLERPDTDRRPR